MSELFLCGFEEQDIGGTTAGPWNAMVAAGATISNTVAHSGTYSGKIFPTTAAQTYFQRTTANTTTGTITTRFYFYPVTPGTAIDPTIFETVSNTNAQSLMVRYMRTGALKLVNVAATTEATTSTILTANTYWYRIETQHVISDTAGTMELKLYLGNSTTALETLLLDGVGHAGEDTLATNNSSYFFGQRTNPSTTCTFYLDDIKIIDDLVTYPGPGNTAIMTVNGNTSVTWTSSGGGSATFANVDEIPGTLNDADYNFDITATNEDKLAMTSLPAEVPSNAVLKVMSCYARVAMSATGGTHRLVLRVWNESGTGTDSTFIQLASTSFRVLTPAEHLSYDLTGKTKANLDSFSLGYRSTVGITTEKRLSAIWANVEWLEAASTDVAIAGSVSTSGKGTSVPGIEIPL